MKGFYQFAIEHDLDISMYVINKRTQEEKSYEQLCYEHNIAGAVIFGLKNTDPYYKLLVDSKNPCVTIDVEVGGANVSNVTNDHMAAFDELTQYLIDQGHRKIVLVCGRENAAVTSQRMEGALRALRRNGLELPEDYSVVGYGGIYVTEYTDPKITTVDQNIKEKGYEAAHLLYDMIEGIRPAQNLILPHKLELRDSVKKLENNR